MHFSIRRGDKQNKKAASFLLSTYSEHMHIQEQVSVYNCIPRDTVFDTEDEARVFLLSLGGGPSTVIVSNHDVAVFTNHTSRKMVRRVCNLHTRPCHVRRFLSFTKLVSEQADCGIHTTCSLTTGILACL